MMQWTCMGSSTVFIDEETPFWLKKKSDIGETKLLMIIIYLLTVHINKSSLSSFIH